MSAATPITGRRYVVPLVLVTSLFFLNSPTLAIPATEAE